MEPPYAIVTPYCAACWINETLCCLAPCSTACRGESLFRAFQPGEIRLVLLVIPKAVTGSCAHAHGILGTAAKTETEPATALHLVAPPLFFYSIVAFRAHTNALRRGKEVAGGGLICCVCAGHADPLRCVCCCLSARARPVRRCATNDTLRFVTHLTRTLPRPHPLLVFPTKLALAVGSRSAGEEVAVALDSLVQAALVESHENIFTQHRTQLPVCNSLAALRHRTNEGFEGLAVVEVAL